MKKCVIGNKSLILVLMFLVLGVFVGGGVEALAPEECSSLPGSWWTQVKYEFDQPCNTYYDYTPYSGYCAQYDSDLIYVGGFCINEIDGFSQQTSNYFLCCSTCGNEVIDAEEECDDGNTVDGDGCSSECTIETGKKCQAFYSPVRYNCSTGELDYGDANWYFQEVCEDPLVIGSRDTSGWNDFSDYNPLAGFCSTSYQKVGDSCSDGNDCFLPPTEPPQGEPDVSTCNCPEKKNCFSIYSKVYDCATSSFSSGEWIGSSASCFSESEIIDAFSSYQKNSWVKNTDDGGSCSYLYYSLGSTSCEDSSECSRPAAPSNPSSSDCTCTPECALNSDCSDEDGNPCTRPVCNSNGYCEEENVEDAGRPSGCDGETDCSVEACNGEGTCLKYDEPLDGFYKVPISSSVYCDGIGTPAWSNLFWKNRGYYYVDSSQPSSLCCAQPTCDTASTYTSVSGGETKYQCASKSVCEGATGYSSLSDERCGVEEDDSYCCYTTTITGSDGSKTKVYSPWSLVVVGGEGDLPNLPSNVCGNGVKEVANGEQCDDGNVVSGDGCSAECILEQNPSNPTCSNGVIDAGEQCDDGNSVNGDGCDSYCQKENPGECGNEDIGLGEQCDDGNRVPLDGCDEYCQLEAPNICGDGVRIISEECDDGNSVNSDGCSSNCILEWGCESDSPSAQCPEVWWEDESGSRLAPDSVVSVGQTIKMVVDTGESGSADFEIWDVDDDLNGEDGSSDSISQYGDVQIVTGENRREVTVSTDLFEKGNDSLEGEIQEWRFLYHGPLIKGVISDQILVVEESNPCQDVTCEGDLVCNSETGECEIDIGNGCNRCAECETGFWSGVFGEGCTSDKCSALGDCVFNLDDETCNPNPLFCDGTEPILPPKIEIVSPSCGDYGFLGENVTVTYFVDNGDSTMEVSIDWGDGNIDEGLSDGDTVNHTYFNSGTKTISVMVNDSVRSRLEKRLINYIVIDPNREYTYAVACIDEPEDYQKIDESVVRFLANSSKGIYYNPNAEPPMEIIPHDSPRLLYHWNFSNGKDNPNKEGDNPLSWDFYKVFVEAGDQYAELEVEIN